MAVSASASHQQSLETGLERKLEKEKKYKDLLSDEKLLLDNCCNHDKIQGEMIATECTDGVHGQTDDAIDNILDVEDELRSIHRQLQSARRMLNLPTKDDSNGDTSDLESDGDYGFLADLLHISTVNIVSENRNCDDVECTDINLINRNRFNTALDTIVGQKFSIKVCRDSIVAQRLMQNQELQWMRIWPIDRLVSSTKRSDGYSEILRKYKNVAIDPISMVQICRTPQILRESELRRNSLPIVEFGCDIKFADLSMQRVLMKAVENWIIVRNDHDAGRIIQDKILSKHITGCVTLGGSKHRLGTLTTASKDSYCSQAKNRLDLPIDTQIKYRHLTSAYLKLKSRVNAFYRQKMELEDSERQSNRLQELQSLLVITEKNIIELTRSLKVQIEKAAEAHR